MERTRQIDRIMKNEEELFISWIALLQDAEKAGVEVTEEDIKAERERIQKAIGHIDASCDEVAVEVGFSLDEFNGLLRDQAISL